MKWRLGGSNLISTPDSGTTVYINYSNALNILEVEFAGGRVYHYKNVEPEIWEEYKSEIESGGSSGTFINTRIKPFYEAKEIT